MTKSVYSVKKQFRRSRRSGVSQMTLNNVSCQVERNIEGFNLLTGINSAEELIESRQSKFDVDIDKQ